MTGVLWLKIKQALEIGFNHNCVPDNNMMKSKALQSNPGIK